MVRKALLVAVAGLAASGSAAFADEVIFKSNTGGAPGALGAANGVFTHQNGIGITAITPADPLAVTGFDFDMANNTGAAIPAGTSIEITAWVWDFEDAASAGTTPAFQTLLRTEAGVVGPLAAAWGNLSFIPLANPNPTLPAFAFSTPVTGFTDTEMAWAFAVKSNGGAGTVFNSVNGLSVLYRTGGGSAPTVGASDGYFYGAQDGEAILTPGNFWGENAFTLGSATQISFAVFNQSTAATPLGVAAAGTFPGVPLASCDPGNTVTLLVQVTPGTQPDSTGITVVADTSVLPGGGPGTSMFDDGLNDDGAAADNEFGLVVSLPPGPEVTLAVPFVVADAEARSANGTININRDTYANLPENITGGGTGATTISGVRQGNDDDMFAVCVSDANAFGASVVGGATWDSQLFLFDSQGLGVLHNDDDPNDLSGNTFQSNITGVPLAQGGLYYLLITGWNRDPMSLGNQLIWNDDDGAGNFNTVRPADGPGAANPILLYLGAGNAGGAYTITLTGANAVCPADISNGNGEAKPDCAVDINDLLFFLSQFEAGNVIVDLTDSSFAGPDCAVDINDLLFFLTRFENGC